MLILVFFKAAGCKNLVKLLIINFIFELSRRSEALVESELVVPFLIDWYIRFDDYW